MYVKNIVIEIIKLDLFKIVFCVKMKLKLSWFFFIIFDFDKIVV